MDLKNIALYFALGRAYGLGRAWALQQGLAQDADKWITLEPNGKGKGVTHVKLDAETGEVKAGMGGKFNGKHISAIGKNEEHGAQAKIDRAKAIANGWSAKKAEPEKPKAPEPRLTSKEKRRKQLCDKIELPFLRGEELERLRQTIKAEPFDEDMAKALLGWSSEAYEAINNYVRMSDWDFDWRYGQKAKDIRKWCEPFAKSIKQAFNKSKTTEELTLYRVMSLRRYREWRKGDTFTTSGFTSTSLSADGPHEFLEFADEPVIVEMVVPPGYPVIDAKRYSEVPEEDEVLLPHKSKGKIVEQGRKGRYNYIRVMMENWNE